MNKQTVAHRPGRCAPLLASLAGCGAVALSIPACTPSPFATEASDYGPRASAERLRMVGSLRLEDMAKPRPEPGAPAAVITEPPPDPFTGLERVEVSIEQARAWTLANNLDLQVSLIDPTIAREGLSGEEAKYEWVLGTRVRYQQLDSAVSSTLSNNQAELLDVTPGVDIPLRTGGTVRVELPLNRTETNNQNQFTFLNPSYATDAAVSISQPLLRNAGRRTSTHSIRIQALETDIAEARAKLEIIRRLADVERAYWRLYAAERILAVRQEQFELARRQLQQAERRFRSQVVAEVEVIRAQSGVAERLESIIRAQNTVRDFQRELKRIMNADGLKVGSPRIVSLQTQPDPVEYELDAPALAEAAIVNRMEMLELELRIAQDYSNIDFAKNQALPEFTLDYRYGINGLGSEFTDSVSVLRGNKFEDWSVGANFSVPLGNEEAEARVHQAILRRLQRLATREAREVAIRQEIFNAVDELGASWNRILAARQAVILAARTLRAEENQFEVGRRTSTDVLDAAARLADAQSSEISALTDYQVAQVDLAFATGTLMGSTKVDWTPRDPRTPSDFVGESTGRVPLGPAGVPVRDGTVVPLENKPEEPRPRPVGPIQADVGRKDHPSKWTYDDYAKPEPGEVVEPAAPADSAPTEPSATPDAPGSQPPVAPEPAPSPGS